VASKRPGLSSWRQRHCRHETWRGSLSHRGARSPNPDASFRRPPARPPACLPACLQRIVGFCCSASAHWRSPGRQAGTPRPSRRRLSRAAALACHFRPVCEGLAGRHRLRWRTSTVVVFRRRSPSSSSSRLFLVLALVLTNNSSATKTTRRRRTRRRRRRRRARQRSGWPPSCCSVLSRFISWYVHTRGERKRRSKDRPGTTRPQE
jgi:hypothetical protein